MDLKVRAKPRIGFEIEIFTLDTNGEIIPGADDVINMPEGTYTRQECGCSMLEVGAIPKKRVKNAALLFVQNMQTITEAAKKDGIRLCPLASYPGKYDAVLREKKWYVYKRHVMGDKKMDMAAKCIGFHHHYGLPKGTYDKVEHRLKEPMNPRNRDVLVDEYNLLTAMDPALTTFLQSSPFFDGVHLGKDSRIMTYRGVGYDGVYKDLSLFGSLLPYEESFESLQVTINRKIIEWELLMTDAGCPKDEVFKHIAKMDVGWSPIKVNKLGTLEERGMDMNHLSYLVGASILIKSIMRRVVEGLGVVADDLGKAEPFTVEEDIIHIPPYMHLKELELGSATKGFDDIDVHKYCKNFIEFGMLCAHKKYHPILDRLKHMADKKENESDLLLKWAKKQGYENEIPNNVAKDMALRASDRFEKDIEETLKLLENL